MNYGRYLLTFCPWPAPVVSAQLCVALIHSTLVPTAQGWRGTDI